MNSTKILLIIPLVLTYSLQCMDDSQDNTLGAGQSAPIKVVAPMAAKALSCAPVARKDTPIPAAPTSGAKQSINPTQVTATMPAENTYHVAAPSVPASESNSAPYKYEDKFGFFEFATGILMSRGILSHRPQISDASSSQPSDADRDVMNSIRALSGLPSDTAEHRDTKHKYKKKDKTQDSSSKHSKSSSSKSATNDTD